MRWEDYDVVKTFFHRGFETLVAAGGGDHPFIVSKLGSVVGHEQTPGVHFFGAMRERLFNTQIEIARRARAVTVLSNRSAALWWREHGSRAQLLQVPTGVDADIPGAGPNPYRALGIKGPIAIFAGNLYTGHQPEVNGIWQDRLNRVGALLKRHGITLVAIGPGATDRLDPGLVTHVGRIEGAAFWDWQRYAQVGLVLAQGPVQDNESSKIYYYLRTGLPVICESPVPNAWLIELTRLGAIVPYDDVAAMADSAAEIAFSPPGIEGVVEYMTANHSWDARAAIYDPVFSQARASQVSRAS